MSEYKALNKTNLMLFNSAIKCRQKYIVEETDANAVKHFQLMAWGWL